MKTCKILITVLFLFLLTSPDASSQSPWSRRNHKPKYSGSSVGAPLDGGILSVLGVAGVAYFVARKKKKGNL